MKNLKVDSFEEFVLTNEEMIHIRGGNGYTTMVMDGGGRPPVIIIEI